MYQSSRHHSTQASPWRFIRQLALFGLLVGYIVVPELHRARHSFAACDDTTIAMAAGQQFLTTPDCAGRQQHNAQRCPLCQLFAQLFSAPPQGALSCQSAPAPARRPLFCYQAGQLSAAQRSCQSRAPPVFAATC